MKPLNTRLAFGVLIAVFISTTAQSANDGMNGSTVEIELQCKYAIYDTNGEAWASGAGLYFRLEKSVVEIVGTPFFDGAYAVATIDGGSVTFENDKFSILSKSSDLRGSRFGDINRVNGELVISLFLGNDEVQMLMASCSPLKRLF